jgi:hypothetical protein
LFDCTVDGRIVGELPLLDAFVALPPLTLVAVAGPCARPPWVHGPDLCLGGNAVARSATVKIRAACCKLWEDRRGSPRLW